MQARGFTVLSPSGKVVDLGTEFGLSVADGGATSVRVFTGLVEAFPLAAAGNGEPGVTIHQDQTAQIDGRTVALDPRVSEKDTVSYVRAILPPPVRTPRTLNLDFTQPAPGTLLDGEGRGIGLTHRLPGTGSALAERDPNLRLRPDRRALELTTTRSDLTPRIACPPANTSVSAWPTWASPARKISRSAHRSRTSPASRWSASSGCMPGSRSNKNIRGGLIRRPAPDSYRLFLVNNPDGNDTDIYEIGLMTTGDDLRLILRRVSGRYSLQVDNLTRNSSSTLEIAHPAFLDARERPLRRALRRQHPERSPRDADDSRSEGHRLDDPAPEPDNGPDWHEELT